MRDTLANNYIRPDEATKAQSKVKQKGRYTFIDKVKVRLVGNTYGAECVNFGTNSLHISDDDVSVRAASRLIQPQGLQAAGSDNGPPQMAQRRRSSRRIRGLAQERVTRCTKARLP